MRRRRSGPGAPGSPAQAGATLGHVDDFVARVIRRLREEPGFSRNRHFVAFSSPEGRRALRIHRHLRSIETDLTRGCSATVEQTAGRVRVTLRSKSSLRMAWLSHDEYRILRTSPVVRAALDDGAPPMDACGGDDRGAQGGEAASRPAARASSARSAATGSDPR